MELRRIGFGLFLGMREWRTLARLAQEDGACCCDLSSILRVYPAGTVGLSLVLRHRAHSGRPTLLVLPAGNADVLRYLDRIDFLRTVAPYVEFDQDWSAVSGYRRHQSSNFTEILDPAKEGFDKIERVAKAFFDREAPSVSQRMLTTVTEALLNIRDHSNPDGGPAPSLVQIQVLPDAFEMAFGDLGTGFLETLRRNPAHQSLSDESAALTGVLRHGFTRFSGLEHRGGGLRTAAEITHELGGRIQVLSRDGFARRHANEDYEFFSIPDAFPGSIVLFRVPRQQS